MTLKLNKYTINVLFFALQCAGIYLSLQLLFWALNIQNGVDIWRAIPAAFALFAYHKIIGLKLEQ